MQLTITALGDKSIRFVSEILLIISNCKCSIVEVRSSNLADTTASYFLVDGNWNHIAKLELLLSVLKQSLDIQLLMLRTDLEQKKIEGIPYSIETLSVDKHNIVEDISNFLFERHICIEEVSASRFQASYAATTIFSSKFILLIPSEVRLLLFREEFLEFCDIQNIDAMIEPIKR